MGKKSKDGGECSTNDDRIAVVDIGSNSVRLVVFDGIKRTPATIFNEKVLCGLGRELASTGRLSKSGVERALVNIQRFVGLTRSMGVENVHFLATAAARDAKDGPDFVSQVEKISGQKVQVLSGQEEARLSASGVIAGMPEADGIMGDLGGGSLELVDIRNREVGHGVTLPLGPLRLLDLHGNSRSAARKEIAKQLDKIEWLTKGKGRGFFPVGGAWRNLARLDIEQSHHPLHVVHGYILPYRQARRLTKLVGGLTPDSLRAIGNMQKRRLEVMPLGAMILDALLRRTKSEQCVFSSFGLREGFLFEQLVKAQRSEDPLLTIAQALADREARFADLGGELFEWTASLFPEEGDTSQRLRHAVCILSDLTWREHTDYRAELAFRRILYHPLVGIDHPGRVFVALALYVRYGGSASDERIAAFLPLVSIKHRMRAIMLGLALRLAYRVSGATTGILARSRLRWAGKELQLDLPDDGPLLDGETVQKSLAELNSFAETGKTLLMT